MADGEPVDVVAILRKLLFSSHPYVPIAGEAQGAPSEYVAMTGRISPGELEDLKEALTGGSSKRDKSGTEEPGS